MSLQLQKGKYKMKIPTNKNEIRGKRVGPKANWVKLLEHFMSTRVTTKNTKLYDEFINSLNGTRNHGPRICLVMMTIT